MGIHRSRAAYSPHTHTNAMFFKLALIASIPLANCRSLNTSTQIILTNTTLAGSDIQTAILDSMTDQPKNLDDEGDSEHFLDTQKAKNDTRILELEPEQDKPINPFLISVQISGAAGVVLVLITFYFAILNTLKPERDRRLVWAKRAS